MTLVGHTLGEFEILERLGQGGMGAVYKARQLSLKRLVALKTLQPAVADDEAYIARFQQEAIAAAGLNHPNLVQVFSAGESNGLHWFSMEYVEGESARARLKREGRIDPREAIAIAICVATALQYGWRKASLIHRDVKPDNIFISRYGEVKLGDLGLAKNASESKGLTSTGHSLGTPYYISPEQARDSKTVDRRADIYSLGCTLFHMVTGRPPFDGSSAAAILLKHITDAVPILQHEWPQCPPLLSDLVGKMMQKDPADRQQDYESLIRDLRFAWAKAGIHTTPATPAPAPASPVRSGPAPVEIRDASVTSVVDVDLDAPTMPTPAPPPECETIPAPGSNPRRTPAVEMDHPSGPDLDAPTMPTPVSAPAGTGELRLETPISVDHAAPMIAGPAPIPPWASSKETPAPDPERKSLPLGKITVALAVIGALLYFFLGHHGNMPSMTVADESKEPPAVDSPWLDWVVEGRRDGYFLYHREFLDHKDEVIFQRRAAANSDVTFRNGKIKVRCVIPSANDPAQYVQFYLRQAADAKGVIRRYEAYLTHNTMVFALNDSAQGAHEITHWTNVPTMPDAPVDIYVEIVARKNTFSIFLNNQLVGIAQDDTLPGPGTFGVDGPAETRLTMLAVSTSDPLPSTPNPKPSPAPPTTK